jgi:anti-sigma regulatory factor (Ser/Thr protein kinase)
VTTQHFTFDPASVGRARRWLADEVVDVDIDVETAKLLLTELATNAVVHARSEFDVTVDDAGDRLTVSVADGSPHAPTVSTPAPDDLGGRGLFLVAQLAARWGVERRGTGKLVWFELPRE